MEGDGPAARPLRVAVVGAGPSGVYVADALTFDAQHAVAVDLLERLPVPFGLLRHGVAPDHVAVRSTQDVLDEVLLRPGVRLLCDVEVGRDVHVEQLRAAYDVVVHAGGAPAERRLGVPGEQLPGCAHAHDLVRAYGGWPDAPAVPLRGPAVAVVGGGNVALDLARILLQDPARLRSTDVPEPVLDALRDAQVRTVHLLVRRGAADVRFTAKELRELGALPDLDVLLHPGGEDLAAVGPSGTAQRRTLAVLQQWASRPSTGATRQLHVHLHTRPLQVLGSTEVDGLRVATPAGEQQLPVRTVLAAVGATTAPVAGLPWSDSGLPCAGTRLVRDGVPSLREHVAGWARRAGSGVLGLARSDGLDVADAVLADLPQLLAQPDPGGLDALLGVQPRDAQDWAAVRRAERAHGATLGRGPVKLTRSADLRAARAAVPTGG